MEKVKRSYLFRVKLMGDPDKPLGSNRLIESYGKNKRDAYQKMLLAQKRKLLNLGYAGADGGYLVFTKKTVPKKALKLGSKLGIRVPKYGTKIPFTVKDGRTVLSHHDVVFEHRGKYHRSYKSSENSYNPQTGKITTRKIN